MAGETILIIDDNADVRTLLGERVLPGHGYRTLTAPDGQEGLWQIRAGRPDLILLDLRLPDMNGMELLHILSAEDYDIPVILLTAYGSEWIAAQALRLGVQDYIIKPFTVDEVLSSIERALTTRRLQKERNALSDRLQCCRQALRSLSRPNGETPSEEEIGRLLEGATAATEARLSRLWIAKTGTLYLWAVCNGPGRKAYFLHRQEKRPPVEQALVQGTKQQWAEEGGGMGLALPISLLGRPGAVLEVLFPAETLPEEAGLVLEAFAGHLGLTLEQMQLCQEAAALHRRFEALASFSRDVLLVLDENETIVAASPSIEALTGQPPEQVIGCGFRQWVQALESPQGEVLEGYLRRSLHEGTAERYALLYRGAEGETRQAEVEVLVRQKEGEEERHYLLFHEVTARGRMEREIRSLRRTLGEFVRGTRMGLLLADLSGNVLAVSGELSRVFQASTEALLGRPAWEALAEGKHLLAEEVARTCRQGSGYVELPAPWEGAGRVGMTLFLLSQAGGKPQAIAILVGPALSTETAGESNPR